MKARIFAKFFIAVICLLGVAVAATDYLIRLEAESNYLQNKRRELLENASLIARTSASNIDLLPKLASSAGARITVFDPAGKPVADSLSALPIEPSGPEITQARSGASGADIRKTGHGRAIFVAVPTPPGFLRLEATTSDMANEVGSLRKAMLKSIALAFLPAIGIALFFAHRTSSRLGSIISFAGELANGNFHARLPDLKSGELGLLSRKLNETSAKLERTVQQLQTEHSELEKLERIRKDFVINVSHELRTPLASIQGYTETLMDGALEDQENNMRFLSIIRHNAERLARLTADLLALSRIELKTQEFRFASYNVNELLADVLATILPIAEKKSIDLKQELAPPETEAFCDSEAIYQILSNLLDNAVKYTPENGVITVGAYPVAGTGMVEIFVRDSGIGIPAEDQPRLFERFYRVDKARSRELGGTGLGLAIVKHLVRSHGGQVRVESQVNKGATFFFTLPGEAPVESARPELHSQFTGM